MNKVNKIKAVFACGARGEFGKKGKLPWDTLKGDLPRFLAYTKDQVVVMGRATWVSLPKKLQGRVNVVLSNNKQVSWKEQDELIEFPDVIMKSDIKTALVELKSDYPDK